MTQTTVVTTGTIGPPGPKGDPGPTGLQGPQGSSGYGQALFSMEGPLETKTGALRYRIVGSQKIAGVDISAAVSPVGSDIIVDVNLNGSTIFTDQSLRPTISPGANDSGLRFPNIVNVSEGDYLTVDIDQVGSTTPGNDLVVQILLGDGDTNVVIDVVGPPGPRGLGMATFGMDGNVIVKTGTARWTSIGATTITGVLATVGTAPTGASIIVDVKKNGTTIFTTTGNRPTIAAGSNSSGVKSPDVTALADGDYLTVDVVQIGSTVSGADLTVEVVLI